MRYINLRLLTYLLTYFPLIKMCMSADNTSDDFFCVNTVNYVKQQSAMLNNLKFPTKSELRSQLARKIDFSFAKLIAMLF